MEQLSIITDRNELRKVLEDILTELLPEREIREDKQPEIDILDMSGIAAYLSEIGIKATRSYIQQLVARRKIPYIEFDEKLLFSKKEVLATIMANKVIPISEKDALKGMVSRMRKKDTNGFF